MLRKIVGQLRDWTERGHSVKLFALSDQTAANAALRDIEHEILPAGGAQVRLRQVRAMVDRIVDWHPDLAYFRMAAYYPPMKRLFQEVPVVVEMTTDDLAEYRQAMNPLKFTLYRSLRQNILRHAAGFACVSHELLERLAPANKRRIVISNGILLDSITPFPAPQNDRPHLIFAGWPEYYWNGVEAIVEAADALPDCDFTLVGYDSRDVATAPGNVSLPGRLRHAEYLAVLATADAAIGTLALYRKQMLEACPLKVREYLAYGVPTIVGYRDVDFPNPCDFLLQLANEEGSLRNEIDAVRQFVNAWKGRRVKQESILAVDAKAKESQRMAFFQSILASG